MACRQLAGLIDILRHQQATKDFHLEHLPYEVAARLLEQEGSSLEVGHLVDFAGRNNASYWNLGHPGVYRQLHNTRKLVIGRQE